jgi:hypothetical protein
MSILSYKKVLKQLYFHNHVSKTLQSFPSSLPGLVDSRLEDTNVRSECVTKPVLSGGEFSGPRGGTKHLSTFRKDRKQWSSNKVVNKMVLGSDVGLEDTCSLSLYALVGRFAYGICVVRKTPAWMERVWCLC